MPEEVRASAMAFREKGSARLEALRRAGEDPAHTKEANRRRGEKVAQQQREFRDWDAAHGGEADLEVFRREVLPGLQTVSLGAMARATGLSEGYCSFIRRGIKIPHRRHWQKLAKLAMTGATDPIECLRSPDHILQRISPVHVRPAEESDN